MKDSSFLLLDANVVIQLFRCGAWRGLTERSTVYVSFNHLKALDDEGKSKQLAAALGLSEPDHAEMRSEFKHRFLGLALEVYRRDEISRGKLRELVAMVDLSADDLDQILDDAGLDGEDDSTP